MQRKDIINLIDLLKKEIDDPADRRHFSEEAHAIITQREKVARWNLGLTAKTILPVLAILVFVMSFIAIFNYKSHIAIVNDMARESLDNAVDLGQRRMGSQIRSDQQLPLLVSSLDEIRKIYEVEGGILVSETAATAKTATAGGMLSRSLNMRPIFQHFRTSRTASSSLMSSAR
ncbi:MAG: hypothetical protein MZV70_28315 [Desulfobacterales bacterium]|nr:hypothetical protein [Desulfobacterales bacterium]